MTKKILKRTMPNKSLMDVRAPAACNLRPPFSYVLGVSWKNRLLVSILMKKTIGLQNWVAVILSMCATIRPGRKGRGLLRKKAEPACSVLIWIVKNVMQLHRQTESKYGCLFPVSRTCLLLTKRGPKISLVCLYEDLNGITHRSDRFLLSHLKFCFNATRSVNSSEH